MIVLLAVLATLAVPETALARKDISYSPDTGLLVTATSPGQLLVRVREDQGVLEWQLTGNSLMPGIGCRGGTFDVFCFPSGSKAVTVTLSDADAAGGDRWIYDEVQLGSDVPTLMSSLTIDGRGGRDEIQGSRGPDTIVGGGGNDHLEANLGNDFVEAGPGDDTIFATNFRTVTGAESTGPNGADVYRGGSGSDHLTYIGRREPVVVTLDAEANDGAAGENDNAGADDRVEEVGGGQRGDTLVGNAAANQLFGNQGADRLEGGGGDDFLSGNDDADEVIGGPGADSINGGPGNDSLNAKDGRRDNEVDCGAGSGDSAVVDLFDTASSRIVTNCEVVSRFAIDDAPPGLPLGQRLRIDPGGVARVSIECPRRARVRCQGRMSLRDPKRRGRVLASGSYSARLGGKALVALRLTTNEQALLRRRGEVLVTTSEQGISRRGPRSVERLLRLSRS